MPRGVHFNKQKTVNMCNDFKYSTFNKSLKIVGNIRCFKVTGSQNDQFSSLLKAKKRAHARPIPPLPPCTHLHAFGRPPLPPQLRAYYINGPQCELHKQCEQLINY